MIITSSPSLVLISILQTVFYTEILNMLYQSRLIPDAIRVRTGRPPYSALVTVVMVTFDIFPYLADMDHCIFVAVRYSLVYVAILAHRDLQTWSDFRQLLPEGLYVYLFSLCVLFGQANSLRIIR